MNLQEIDVFIDANGEVKIEVRGVKGESCLGLTQGLERALGDQVLKREATPEMSETPTNQNEQWNRHGA
jgi:hypothetical protein